MDEQDHFFTDPDYQTPFQTKAWRNAWLTAWGSKPHSIDHTSDIYRTPFKVKGLLTLSADQVVGSGSQALRSVRREYFRPRQSADSFLHAAFDSTKHQLIMSDVVQNSHFYRAVKEFGHQHQIKILEKNPSVAYSLDTASLSFSDYLNQLSSNTRAKLCNRRQRLARHGTITLTRADEHQSFIDVLNRFHQKRWGKPCFQGRNRVFISELIAQLPEEGADVQCNELRVNGDVESVLLDIRLGNRVYNFQSGYSEDRFKGLSLGTLHLGYQIETAFNEATVTTYDFMAGSGRSTNYKAKLANQSVNLCDMVLVKSRILSSLLKVQDWVGNR